MKLPREETRIIRLAAAGYTDRGIAIEMRLPRYSVVQRLYRLRRRWGLTSRAQLISFAWLAGIVKPRHLPYLKAIVRKQTGK